MDPDLPCKVEGDPRRVFERQKYLNLYKYQHIYLLPLYGLFGIKCRIQDVTDTYIGRFNGGIRVNPVPIGE